MAYYETGTVANRDELYTKIESLLTGVGRGWTVHHTFNATVGTRDKVFRGTELTTGLGNAPLVRMAESTTTRIWFTGYFDFDTVGAVGLGQHSGGSAYTYFDTSTTTFGYFIRLNQWSFTVCAKLGTTYRKTYQGFLRRAVPTQFNGVTTSTSALAVGATSIPTAASMVGRLQVGQKVIIQNFAHDNVSANKANFEAVTISAISSTALTVSATTKAYDTGALVGHLPMPLATGQFSDGSYVGTIYAPYSLGGLVTSTAYGATLAASDSFFHMPETAGDPASNNLYYAGLMSYYATVASGDGPHGFAYHQLNVTGNTQAMEDIFDTADGKTYICIGSDTGRAWGLGPRENA